MINDFSLLVWYGIVFSYGYGGIRVHTFVGRRKGKGRKERGSNLGQVTLRGVSYPSVLVVRVVSSSLGLAPPLPWCKIQLGKVND